MMRCAVIALCVVAGGAVPARAQGGSGGAPEWPAVTEQTRPWTRWWWMGSAVDTADLTRSLEAYRAAGLGGVEITPIYGVVGQEKNFIEYLSPSWVRMLEYTLRQGKRLGMGVDMNNGTGWPFGGPQVGPADEAKYVAYRTYTLDGGERLRDTIADRQAPILSVVGFHAHQPGDTASEPRVRIEDLARPISRNPDLQKLAINQVRFPDAMPLRALMAYSDSGRVIELTDRVGPDGRLDWTAPPGHWTLYAVFQGWHGKMVERAAPGGEGFALDHFSGEALQHYLRRFDQAFAGADLSGLRAFFNDSYEVDDARGQADWTPAFFAEFRARRGYDLRDHLPALFGKDTPERNARVRSDYRETISDLILDRFTTGWRHWARTKNAIIRDQAHGSPGNILDL
ncbi:MAG TPA: glycosyl hydrolase, partial [Longimicrobiaceae bacterium]|nr:glycosyl hydrolase [Longimicrobiaceae bacterium]